jgi:hypothetical protein
MLNDLLNCGTPWIEEKAKIALELKEQFDQGTISKEEFEEIMQDLFRAEDIEAQSGDIQLKSTLISGIQNIMKLI